MDKDPNEKDRSFITTAIVISIFIISLWMLTFLMLKDKNDRGTFGDMFGSINALFSGLALAGIILTILLQRKELSLQREELVETRRELKRTANAQERSESALNRQAQNLKISATLSALNTLLNYYADEEKQLVKIMSTHKSISEFRQKKQNCVKRIEEILESKDNF
jgi:hypothetical protein